MNGEKGKKKKTHTDAYRRRLGFVSKRYSSIKPLDQIVCSLSHWGKLELQRQGFFLPSSPNHTWDNNLLSENIEAHQPLGFASGRTWINRSVCCLWNKVAYYYLLFIVLFLNFMLTTAGLGFEGFDGILQVGYDVRYWCLLHFLTDFINTNDVS